jgi:A/G-specific adenine glycosylase
MPRRRSPEDSTVLDDLRALRSSIRPKLIRWYRRHKRELSWRGGRDPYAIWLTEIMLQQTRVEQGTPYIERFLREFPTVEALARANEARVLKLWEGLGYYSRARNLHRAARMVQSELGGRFPEDVPGWMALPGVGRYTAGAVVSIAFDRPAPLVDGNVKRVIARLGDVTVPVDDARIGDAIWAIMTDWVRGRSPGDFNQAMMELGSQVCRPKKPSCASCPVNEYCLAHARGTVEQRPVRIPKKATPHKDIVVGVISRRGRYLIGQRPPDGLLGGLWEFPGGKVEPGESHEAALRRELREELSLGVRPGEKIAEVTHAYSHFRVTLHVYRCNAPQGNPIPRAHTQLKWVRKIEFQNYAFPKANHKFLDRV